MNIRTTIVLLILVTITAAYFVFVESKSQTSSEREKIQKQRSKEPGQALFTLDRFSIEATTSVEYQKKDAPPVTIRKEGENWYQTQPVRFPLNTWSARKLVEDAAGLRCNERFQEGEQGKPSLADLSLSPPLAQITFRAEGEHAKEIKLSLGRVGIGGRAYAMIEGDPHVYVVNDALHRLVLNGEAKEWRKRNLDHLAESRTDRVSLTGEGPAIEMIKSEGRWSFAPPFNGRVATEAINKLLGSLSYTYVDQFVADNPADASLYGLDNPSITLTVHRSAIGGATQPDGETADAPAASDQENPTASVGDAAESLLTFKVGSSVDFKNDHYFATYRIEGSDPQEAAGQVIFTIPRSDYDKLVKRVDDFRDPRITIVKPADVKQLIIEPSDGQRLDFVRGVNGWEFAEPGPGFAADDTEVSMLTESISKVKAESYLTDTDASSLGEPLVTMTLIAMGGPEPDVIKVFTRDEKTYLATRGNETVAQVIPKESLTTALEPATAFRERIVLDANVDKLISATLKNSYGAEFTFKRESPAAQPATAPEKETPPVSDDGTNEKSPIEKTSLAGWNLQGETAFEQSAYDAMLKELLPLRAERWLPGDAQPIDSATADLTLVLGFEDGTTETVLVDANQNLASVGGTPDWFVIQPELVQSLNQEYRDRTVIDVQAGEIRRVTTVTGESATTIDQESAGQYTCQEIPTMSQTAAAGLFDALSGLRAVRFISQPEKSRFPVDTSVPYRVEVQTRDDQTLPLTLYPSVKNDVGESLVQIGDRWFLLPAATVQKLTAPLASTPAPQPSASTP
jgi:hypothetical protein